MKRVLLILLCFSYFLPAIAQKKKNVLSGKPRFTVDGNTIDTMKMLRNTGQWRFPITMMWEDALAKARKTNRPVIAFNVDYVDSASKGFRDRILEDPTVQTFLSQHFELAINDFSVDPPPSVGFDSLANLGHRLDGLEKGYAIASRPTAIILAPNGDEIERITLPNLLSSKEFINTIGDFLAGKNNIQSLSHLFWSDTTNFTARTKFLDRLVARAEYDSTIYQLGVISNMKDRPKEASAAAKQYAYLRFSVEGKTAYLKQWIYSLPKKGNDSLEAVQGLHDLLEFYQVRKKIDSIVVGYHNLFDYTGDRDPDVLNNFAWDLTNFSKRWEEALVVINEAISKKPAVSDFYDTRALIHASLQRFDEAIGDEELALHYSLKKEDKKYFIDRIQSYKKQLAASLTKPKEEPSKE